MININPDSPNVVVISPDNTNVTVTSVGLQGPAGEVPSTGAYTGSFSGSFVGDGAQLVNVTASGQIDSASYASFAVSSSYAITASHALNVPDTASYALTASFALNVPATASTALTALNATSASYAVTASYALSASVEITKEVSSSYADTASYVETAQTASYVELAQTASYIDYNNIDSLPTLVSGSSQITIGDTTGNLLGNRISGPVSDAVNATSASYAVTASYAISASVEITKEVSSSYADTASYVELSQTASVALTSSYNENPVISGSITGPDYIDFNTGITPPHTEGRLFYDQPNGALGFYNEEADITLQIGQEFYKRVYNNSGGLISNGTPVRISGSQGDVPYIWPAFSKNIYSGSYDVQENKIIGLATHDIEDNSVGYVTEFGVVRGVNTTAFAAGDQLFLQTGSAGFRNTPPPFPYDIIPVGEVIRSQTNGFIEVRTSEPITHKNISGVNNIETQVLSDESITIQRGTPVHVVAEGDGPIPRVKIAKSSDSNLMPATFVVEEDILSGSQGTAVSIGYIYDVDTSTFSVGDVIYVAPNGGYTNQKPTGSNLIQNLGVVLKVDATEGSGFVYGSGRSNDVPNIQQGYFWVGNADGVATAVSTGSFLLNTTDTFTGTLTISGSILPENELHDLGSSTQKWRDLYLSGSSIYLGDAIINETDWSQVSGSVVGKSLISSSAQVQIFPYTGSALISGSLEVTGSTTILGDIDIVSSLGTNNIIIGKGAAINEPTALDSVIIGYEAGANSDATGNQNSNVSVGYRAGYNANGFNTTFVGYQAGLGSTTAGSTGFGGSNTAIGANSMLNINGGDFNTAVGAQAGNGLSAGSYNIFLGNNARANDSGGGTENYQIVIGNSVNSKGTGTTIIGTAGQTTHTYLEGIITGSSLEVSQGSGSFSGSFQGDGSGLTNLSADPFPYTGSALISGSLEVTGSTTILGDIDIVSSLGTNNIIIGKGAAINEPTALDSVIIGYEAGANSDTTNNQNSNVSVGYQAGYNANGSSTTFVGYKAGYGSTATGIGAFGSQNTAIGNQAMLNIKGGDFNTAIGSSAGNYLSDGSNNIFVGRGTNTNFGNYANDNYQIVIGDNVSTRGTGTTVIGTPGQTTHTYLEGIITGSSLEVSSALISGSLEVTGSVSILSGSISLIDEYENIIIGSGSSLNSYSNATNNVLVGKDIISFSPTPSILNGNVLVGGEIVVPRGSGNTFLGYRVGEQSNAAQDTNYNTCIGREAGRFIDGGNSNVLIGFAAGVGGGGLTGGDYNTFIGTLTGGGSNPQNTIVIGYNARSKGNGTTYIGIPGITTHTYLEGTIVGSVIETDTLTSKASRFITPGVVTGSNATTTILTGSNFDNEVIRCIYTGSAGTHTITLPLAESTEGLNRQIKFVTDSTINASNIIEVVPSGSQTLNGNPSASLDTAYESLTIWSDGVEWFQL